ncbi:TERT [Acanthosepion pharaonis]|uniref:Telomerase reverse transcriptase n=1 Tax=Acanthosepion pharaonis TaxID=158019 RepID=A0A812BFV0_ACAPH|nr:TERT [Sepia pharaonis]
MAFGFRMLSTNKGAMKTQHYNVECFYPSYIYNRLCSSHFEKLLSRIGDEAMELLMGKRSLFMLLPPNSYLQLTGRIPDFPPPVVSLSNQSKNKKQKMQNLADQIYSLCQRDQNGQPKSKKKESELSVGINKNNDPKTLKKKTRRGKRKPKNILASCSLMKMSFNPYNFYEVIPHTYILYAKDLHQRLDKYLCTTMTNQTSACELVPGISASSTADSACPKCQVKSFLASQLKPLLQKLIKNHRSCHYISLLNYHCPIAVTKAKLQRRASLNKISTNHSKENINTSPKKSAGVKVIKRLITKRRKASIQMLLDDYVLHKQVYRFLRACLLRLIPVELLGSKHNVTILLKNVKKFISLGKFEKLCLGQIMNGMKVSACGWLRKIPSLSWRCHLLCQCLVWIFFNIIMVIIRGFFYVTETSHYRNRLFYYRKPVWLHLRQLAVQNFLSKGMLKPIKHEEVFQKMVKGVCLGVSCLRFLPKKKSFRPIINMNCANLKSLPKKLPIKQQVSGLFYIFNVIKEKYPDLMGHSVFCIDEIYKKWRTFVMKRQQTKDKRPLYFVKIDIQECFNFINQDLLKNIMRDILDMVGEDFIIRKYAKIFCIEGKLKRSFFYEATVESEHNPNFKNYIQHVKDKKKLGNSVIIDKVLYDHMKFDEIIKKLHCHVSNNVVKLDSHYYTQTQGISQGSVLSTLLCNIYYGHMENKMLKLDSDALMMRMVDDFLLVTPQKSTAFRFLNKMLNGIPLYNCSIQPEKTLINFAYDHKTYGKLPQILETEMLPWCGLLIDTKSLNIKRDYSRFSGLGISDILTVNLTPQMAANLCHKILKCINPKCLAIFVDKKINGITTIACNVFNLFYLAAYRFHVFILRLITKQQTLDSAQFFFRIIHYIADQFFKLVKTKMKQINSVQSYPLSKCENKWLCFMAFFIKVSQYQSQYITLHSMLKKACSQGKAMLSTKRKSLLLKTVMDGQLESVLSSMK